MAVNTMLIGTIDWNKKKSKTTNTHHCLEVTLRRARIHCGPARKEGLTELICFSLTQVLLLLNEVFAHIQALLQGQGWHSHDSVAFRRDPLVFKT